MSSAVEHSQLETLDPPTEGRKSLAIIGVVLLFLGILAAYGFGMDRWDKVIQDDTYISLIYSRNLARGHGLVCNPGHEAVEGYTNFSWTVMAAGAIKMGWDPVKFVQVGGLLCSMILVLQTFFLARRIGTSILFAGTAALAMGVRPALSLEAMGGLETCFFALLVQAAIFLTLSPNPRTVTRLGAGLFVALAALTRPEGVFVFGLIELSFLFLAWSGRAKSEEPAKDWLRTSVVRWAPFVLIVGAHFAFRWITYHDYVPNTAHAKVSPGLRLFGRGFDYVFQGIAYFGALFCVLPYLLSRRIIGRGAGVLLFINAAYVFYIFFVGGDFKLTWRFFVVLFPIWCALAAVSFEALGESLRARSPLARGAWALLFLSYMGAHLGWEMTKRPDRNVWGTFLQQMVLAGKHLNTVVDNDAWIASTNAGCIPYFAECNTLDMMGLSDKHIAKVPVKDVAQDKTGHERGDGKYVLDCEPDIILLIRSEFTPTPGSRAQNGRELIENRAIGTSEVEIVKDPRFDRDYKLVSVPLPEMPNPTFFNYFQRTAPKTK